MGIVAERWRAAVHAFGEELRAWEWAGRLPLEADEAAAAAAAAATVPVPPASLVAVPPLAELANAIAATLNDVRQCVPLSIAPTVHHLLGKLVGAAARTITDAYALYQPSMAAKADAGVNPSARYRAMCASFLEEFVPYAEAAVAAVVGHVDGGDSGVGAARELLDSFGLVAAARAAPTAAEGDSSAAESKS